MKYYHTFQIFEPDLKKDRIREEFAQSTWKYLYEHGVIPTYRSNYSRNSKDYGDDSDGCFFKDVINDAIEKAEDTDVIIYTNTDSCLPKNIFKLVESKIKDYGCCYGKRRELSDILPGRHLTDDEIQSFPYTKYGACIFAFTKKWWVENQHKLADCILPKGMWDNNLTYLIKQISLNTRLDNSVYHIAHASTWVRGLSDKGIVLCKTLAQEDLLKLTFLNFLRKGYESIHTDNYESVTTRFCTRVYEIFDAMDSMNFPMESWFNRKWINLNLIIQVYLITNINLN